MQVKLRNVKTDEVEIVCFPICFPQRADDFPFDDWEVVDLVRPNEEEFEESDIRCASFIYDLKPDRLPGKGEKDSSKELHLFLSRWEDSVVLRDLIDVKWSVHNPRVGFRCSTRQMIGVKLSWFIDTRKKLESSVTITRN